MHLRLFLPLLCLALPAGEVLGNDEADFARHLPGCWRYGNIPPSGELPVEPQVVFLSQMCFEGGVEGTVTYATCDGFGSFDCWDGKGSYSLRGNRLHLYSEDQRDAQTCDAQVIPGEQLRLYNCAGAGAAFSERVYTRAR